MTSFGSKIISKKYSLIKVAPCKLSIGKIRTDRVSYKVTLEATICNTDQNGFVGFAIFFIQAMPQKILLKILLDAQN